MYDVAVVIPTFNRLSETVRAIGSISCYDPNRVVIVVIDDAGDLVFDYKNERNVFGIKVLSARLDYNCGAGLARKLGTTLVSARYFMFLDSDDCFLDGWVDSVLSRIDMYRIDKRIFITGKAIGGKHLVVKIRKLISFLPVASQTPVCKFLACFFNLYYTPTVAVHRDLAHFHNKLRFCEDFYTNSCAVIEADEIVFVDEFVCELSREPGSMGGLSGQRFRMFRGELVARFSLLYRFFYNPIFFGLILIGCFYQFFREIIRLVIVFVVRTFDFGKSFFK